MRRKLASAVAMAVLLIAGATGVSGATPGNGSDSTTTAGGSAEPQRPPWIPPEGLLGSMQGGNTVGSDVPREVRSDGYRHVDSERLIARLKELHVNTYVYPIWYQPTDWDDLRTEFLPAAQRAGIDVMVYLVPPSECDLPDGQCSRPYKLDFVRWAKEIAKLSTTYPNLRSWAMDDFFSQFPVEYTERFTSAAKAINPDLGFYITTYYGSATNDEYLDKYGDYVDGIIYPFVDGPHRNTVVADSVDDYLDEILSHLEPRDMRLILLTYTGRVLSARREATPDYTRQVIKTGLAYTARGRLDGVISYGTPMDNAPAPATENRAMYGNGRLSLFMPRNAATEPGWYVAASQEITVQPGFDHYQISLWHRDEQQVVACGYHRKQVLIDGQLIFDHDVCDGPAYRWMQGNILDQWLDVTEHVKGRQTVTLTFRLYEAKTVYDYPIDVGFDHIEATGLVIDNASFETDQGWKLSRNNPKMHAAVDVYNPNRPRELFRAVATQFAGVEQGS